MALPCDLTLSAGQEATVEIGGSGSAGYLWLLDVHGETGVVDAQIRPVDPEPPHRDGLFGGSASQELLVRGLRPGRVTAQLAQARPGQAPVSSFEIEVTVLP